MRFLPPDGVKSVKSNIVWIEPMSGMAFPDSEDDANVPDLQTRPRQLNWPDKQKR
jgi:hypothetical protein